MKRVVRFKVQVFAALVFFGNLSAGCSFNDIEKKQCSATRANVIAATQKASNQRERALAMELANEYVKKNPYAGAKLQAIQVRRQDLHEKYNIPFDNPLSILQPQTRPVQKIKSPPSEPPVHDSPKKAQLPDVPLSSLPPFMREQSDSIPQEEKVAPGVKEERLKEFPDFLGEEQKEELKKDFEKRHIGKKRAAAATKKKKLGAQKEREFFKKNENKIFKITNDAWNNKFPELGKLNNEIKNFFATESVGLFRDYFENVKNYSLRMKEISDTQVGIGTTEELDLIQQLIEDNFKRAQDMFEKAKKENEDPIMKKAGEAKGYLLQKQQEIAAFEKQVKSVIPKIRTNVSKEEMEKDKTARDVFLEQNPSIVEYLNKNMDFLRKLFSKEYNQDIVFLDNIRPNLPVDHNKLDQVISNMKSRIDKDFEEMKIAYNVLQDTVFDQVGQTIRESTEKNLNDKVENANKIKEYLEGLVLADFHSFLEESTQQIDDFIKNAITLKESLPSQKKINNLNTLINSLDIYFLRLKFREKIIEFIASYSEQANRLSASQQSSQEFSLFKKKLQETVEGIIFQFEENPELTEYDFTEDTAELDGLFTKIK